MKICIFGGSFDPVHKGHLEVASKACEQCGLDEVIFLPCSRSPLKEKFPEATDRQRVEMLHSVISSLPWALLDLTDMELPPPSWSWRIAEMFVKKYSSEELYWLMGVDQWEDLTSWGRWKHLATMVTFIVHFRDGHIPKPREGVKSIFIEGNHPASSRELRRRLHAGEAIPSGWLTSSVLDYIKNNRIYS